MIFGWRSEERPTLPYVLLRPEKINKTATSEENNTADGNKNSGKPGKRDKGASVDEQVKIEMEEQ